MSVFLRTGLMGRASADPALSVRYIYGYTERVLALALQAIYISALSAAISLSLIIVSEVFDGHTFTQARNVQAGHATALRSMLRRIHFGALCGSVVFSLFALSVAFSQPGSLLFMPMFCPVAAAVFTAMNVHQLASALMIRLAVDGSTCVSIALLDLVSAGHGAGPDTWLNFGNILVVLYFIADCARIGLRYPRTYRRQRMQLLAESERTNAAHAAKTEFPSSVSHELRTPQTSIRGAPDLCVACAYDPLPDRTAQVLQDTFQNRQKFSAIFMFLQVLETAQIG